MFDKKINPSFKKVVSPFQVDVISLKTEVRMAIAYHSSLFTGMSLQGGRLSYDKIKISGLDFNKSVAKNAAKSKNHYAVLSVKISNLTAQSAQVKWVEGDANAEELDPVKFDSGDSLKQTEARVILAALVHDGEQFAGTLAVSGGGVETFYIIQYVNTNLIMANMVMDGIPIVYPVPISGGRLNF
jgi:hypothetical protein